MKATFPDAYEECKPFSDPLPYSLFSEYLVTGRTTHIDTVPKALSLIRLVKQYGLCQDTLAENLLRILRDLISPKSSISIITTVGDVVTDDSGTETFSTGDDFYYRFAVDKAAEVFSEPAQARLVIERYPQLAIQLLSDIPAAYEEKLPKPPPDEEEEDE